MTDIAATRVDWLDAAAGEFRSGMPEHFERMTWSSDRLRSHQTSELRRLLAHAMAHSRFHRQRLAGIDTGTFDLDDLQSLPVMTKTELMGKFDELVTDERLTIDTVEAHLNSLGDRPDLLFDEYLTLASGGSSGVRGVFVCHRSVIAPYISAILRNGMYEIANAVGWPPPFPIPLTLVAAPTAVHATGSYVHLTRDIALLTMAPATLPFSEIVDRVIRSEPMILAGYPTMIARIADEVAAGNIHISPKMVVVTSEQLTPEMSSRITAGFGMPPVNSFGSSEGLTGSAAPGDDVFTFAGDVAIVEFVDAHERPVTYGEPADHILVTNLLSMAQPLIRYRLDDRATPLPPTEASGHPRAILNGRTDQTVTIGGVAVHPLTFRSALLAETAVTEYQVLCHGRDVILRLVANSPVDTNSVRNRVDGALRAAGAAPERVDIELVDVIERDPLTGKARRFVVV